MNDERGGRARLSVGPTVAYDQLDAGTAETFGSDWRGALAGATKLSDEQSAGLAELPDAIVDHVQAAAARVAREGGDLVFQFDDRSEDEGGGRFLARSGGARTTRAFNVVIFHCHFDAYFRNWHCYLGPHRPGEATT